MLGPVYTKTSTITMPVHIFTVLSLTHSEGFVF